jgi:uncharacterized membrane protein
LTSAEPPSEDEDRQQASAVEPARQEQPPWDAQQQEGVLGSPPPAWYLQYYSGAVPLPEVAEGWAKLVPDAPERMVKMAENEAAHRHWMDRSFVRYRFLALIGALLLAATVLVGGIILIGTGHGVTGLVAILADLAVLLTVLLVRQFGMNGNGT